MNESCLVRPIRILLLGAPGAGKGTYASRLSKNWRLPHIATGDMIREEIHRGSSLGSRFKEYANKGNLVPDSMVNELAKSVHYSTMSRDITRMIFEHYVYYLFEYLFEQE